MASLGIAIVRQYGRGVIFRFGRLPQSAEPAGALRDRHREKPTIIFPAQFLDSARAVAGYLQAEYANGAGTPSTAVVIGGSGAPTPS